MRMSIASQLRPRHCLSVLSSHFPGRPAWPFQFEPPGGRFPKGRRSPLGRGHGARPHREYGNRAAPGPAAEAGKRQPGPRLEYAQRS